MILLLEVKLASLPFVEELFQHTVAKHQHALGQFELL